MLERLPRVRAVSVASLVLTSVGCVKIPQHNFNAPPPPVAPGPPVQSSATVTFEGIPSAPVGTALIAGVPRTINAQQFPGGCANPCFHFGILVAGGKITAWGKKQYSDE